MGPDDIRRAEMRGYQAALDILGMHIARRARDGAPDDEMHALEAARLALTHAPDRPTFGLGVIKHETGVCRPKGGA